MQLAAIIAAAF